MKQLKALDILKDYKNIDFNCNMDNLHLEIDEAIAELEALDNRSCDNCKNGDYYDVTDDIDDDVYICEIFKVGYMNIFDVVKPSEFCCREWESK